MNSAKEKDGTTSENQPGPSQGTSTPTAVMSGSQGPTKNPRGRPKKRQGKSIGGGRKKKQRGEAMSESLEQKTAQKIYKQILEENDPMIINRICRMFVRQKKKDENFFKNPGQLKKKKSIHRHSKESALAFFLEHGYTKKRYSALVKDSIKRNESKRSRNIYPSYSVLDEAKQECVPLGIQSSEREVRVPLQKLANKTAERLCESVAPLWSEKAVKRIKIIFSGGFDSAAAHTNTQQRCEDPANECDDAQRSLFVTSVTPLQFVSESDSVSDEYVWYNPTPASYRYCRPVRIAFEKKSPETISREYERLTREIIMLKDYEFTMTNGNEVTITFEFHLTMFDGKCVSNILKVPATQRCPICLRTTHEFGDSDQSFFVQEESPALDLGLALLHAEIKVFEHLLHVSYRKNLEIWAITRDFKDDFQSHKENVKEWVRERFGIRPDQVLQGHGTTNTGNLARRCFKDPKKFAEALKLDEGFVCDLADILILFKTKNQVDYDMLEDYCWKVYWDHYKLYNWALMNVTIHKLLMHGCQVARKLPLPVCYFSEDSQEAWHKFYRRNMTEHARQYSKASRLLDVFLRAIYQSDPLISNILLHERSRFLEKRTFPKRLKKYIIKSGSSDGSDETTSDDEDGDDSDISSTEGTSSSGSDSDDQDLED